MYVVHSTISSLNPTTASAPARQASLRSCSTQVFRRTGSHWVRAFAIGVNGYDGTVVGNISIGQFSGRPGRFGPIGVTVVATQALTNSAAAVAAPRPTPS